MRIPALLFTAGMLLFAACKQEDNPTPTPIRGAYWLSSPTCDDSTDEGHFERFNDSETKYIINQSAINSEVQDTAFVNQYSISSRHIKRNDPASNWHFDYNLKKPILADIILYLDSVSTVGWSDNGAIYGKQQISLNALKYESRLKPGCYRLYYIFYERDPVQTGIPKRVVDKGHYDINVE